MSVAPAVRLVEQAETGQVVHGGPVSWRPCTTASAASCQPSGLAPAGSRADRRSRQAAGRCVGLAMRRAV
jgi:hypothetical protein